MIEGRRILALMPAYNEAGRTVAAVRAMPGGVVDACVVVNDGSTDETPRECAEAGAVVLDHPRRLGIGSAIRTGFRYALEKGFDVVVVLAGNGKDDPREIERLARPIVEGRADLVQGSRYLAGGVFGKMPLHRVVVTRVYPLLVRLTTGFRASDATNGFRAISAAVLRDERLRLDETWLDDPLEYYLYLKVIRIGYRVLEVPVSKIYPQNVPYHRYTKVRPLVDWVPRLKPIVYLTLRLRD